ncbi:MAG: CotH kinase family protein [Treponema sp.]|nr:CotH kinase family protein [Treponema sp.]
MKNQNKKANLNKKNNSSTFFFIFLCTLIFTSCNPSCTLKAIKSDGPKTYYNPEDYIPNNPTPFESRAENLDFIFNNHNLGTTTITIKRSEWDKLCDNYRYFYKNENYVHAEYYAYYKNGKNWTIKNVGMRLRGNSSRFCPQGIDNGRKQGQRNAEWSRDYYNYAERPNDDYRQSHFKIDFEEFLLDKEEMKMSACLKGMALKRLDHSCGREIFCYDMFHKYGIWTAPRASHTRVIIEIIEDKIDNSITTVDYGVYEMFEEVNTQSLKARDNDNITAPNAWKNNKGNLWKCSEAPLTDSSGEGMGIENIVINFDKKGNPIGTTIESYPMDLKTNKKEFDKAAAELKAFIAELNALPTPEDNADRAAINEIKAFYEKWFDIEFFMKTYAVNILFGMDDDYWGNGNNYYLYFDTATEKSTGHVYLIPFDYDNTLGCSIHEGGLFNNPLNWGMDEDKPLMDKLLSVPEYKERFKELLLEVSSKDSYWNFETCKAQFLSWKSMLDPYLASRDLDFHNSVLSWNDYTWRPGGMSLTNRSNNVFDATRRSFEKWLK